MQIMIDKVDADGGSTTWQALLDLLDYRQRRDMQNAFRKARANGVLKRVVSIVDGKSVVTVSRSNGN